MMAKLHYVTTDDQWSKQVAARDKRCRWLGCKRRFGLGAHHIFRRSEPDLRLCLENGIYLCAFHHEWMEGIKSKNQVKYLSVIRSLIGEEIFGMIRKKMAVISKGRSLQLMDDKPWIGSSEISL